MSNKVNDATGEIIEEPKFRSMWSNPLGIKGQDLSNELEDVYQEIQPFAVDPKTGEFLNNSSIPKVIKTGQINVQEKIQSFASDVELYHILEKFAYSEDSAIINQKACAYGDISEMPDNLNDYAQFVNKHIDNLTSLNPELAKMVLDESSTPEQIEAKAKEIYQARIEAQAKAKEQSNGGAE